MRARCVGGFSVKWVPKLLLPPVRIKIFGPKGKIWSKICICGHVPNIGKTLCFSTISLRIANISRQSVANKQEKEVIFMAHYILGNEKWKRSKLIFLWKSMKTNSFVEHGQWNHMITTIYSELEEHYSNNLLFFWLVGTSCEGSTSGNSLLKSVAFAWIKYSFGLYLISPLRNFSFKGPPP